MLMLDAGFWIFDAHRVSRSLLRGSISDSHSCHPACRAVACAEAGARVEGSLTISLLDIGRSAVGVYYSLFLYFSCRRVRRSLLRGSLPKTLPSASHFRYHSCRDRRTNSTPARPRAAACPARLFHCFPV